ncbi:late secretory pathway protein AVL9-like [Chenopodium quinoa]|uniref:late secretory pathway protein AVL9-like n=1 Tax=Chenopodium quinoa TaxID=63459 RepID=UPI000B78483B|nr:late secretory pathway protein AVL9-like [Chenopodium quinoa]
MRNAEGGVNLMGRDAGEEHAEVLEDVEMVQAENEPNDEDDEDGDEDDDGEDGDEEETKHVEDGRDDDEFKESSSSDGGGGGMDANDDRVLMVGVVDSMARTKKRQRIENFDGSSFRVQISELSDQPPDTVGTQGGPSAESSEEGAKVAPSHFTVDLASQ